MNSAQTELLQSFIGPEGDSFQTINEDETLDLGTKLLYLERAISQDCNRFNASLDKIYNPSLNGKAAQPQLDLIRSLKLINDWCFNNPVVNGVYGVRSALTHYFSGLGPVDADSFNKTTVAEINARVAELINSNAVKTEADRVNIEEQKKTRLAKEALTVSQVEWRSVLNLPQAQLFHFDESPFDESPSRRWFSPETKRQLWEAFKIILASLSISVIALSISVLLLSGTLHFLPLIEVQYSMFVQRIVDNLNWWIFCAQLSVILYVITPFFAWIIRCVVDDVAFSALFNHLTSYSFAAILKKCFDFTASCLKAVLCLAGSLAGILLVSAFVVPPALQSLYSFVAFAGGHWLGTGIFMVLEVLDCTVGMLGLPVYIYGSILAFEVLSKVVDEVLYAFSRLLPMATTAPFTRSPEPPQNEREAVPGLYSVRTVLLQSGDMPIWLQRILSRSYESAAESEPRPAEPLSSHYAMASALSSHASQNRPVSPDAQPEAQANNSRSWFSVLPLFSAPARESSPSNSPVANHASTPGV